jgi:hypothetical protein
MSDVETYKKGGKVKKTRRAGAKPRATATAIVNVHLGRKSSKTATQQPRGPTQATQLLGVVNALLRGPIRAPMEQLPFAGREVESVVSELNKPIILEQPKPVSVQAEPSQPLLMIERKKRTLADLQKRLDEARAGQPRDSERKDMDFGKEPARPKTTEEVIAKFGRPFGPTRVDIGMAPIPCGQIQERERSRQYQEDLKTIERMYPDVARQKQLVLLKEFRDERDKSYKERIKELNE